MRYNNFLDEMEIHKEGKILCLTNLDLVREVRISGKTYRIFPLDIKGSNAKTGFLSF